MVKILVSMMSLEPDDENMASALLSLILEFGINSTSFNWSRDSVSIRVKVFSPLIHLGLPLTPGLGIKKDPIKVPLLSETSRILFTTAFAPDVLPTKTILRETCP